MAVVVACAACAAPGRPSPAPGTGSPQPPTTLRPGRTLSRGTLGYAVAFTPDGGTVAVELGDAFELVVRAPGGEARRRVALGEATYDISALALDATGTRALVASLDGTVREIALATGAIARRYHLGRPATAAAFVGERWVATGDDTGVLCLRRAADGALLQCVVAHDQRISAIDSAPASPGYAASRRLATASWNGDVALWDVPSLRASGRQAIAGAATDVAFAPAGDYLAVAFASAPPRRTPAVAARERQGGSARPDPGARAVVWRVSGDDSTHRRDCLGHAGPVTSVTWTADGARLLTGSWDRTVRLWSLADDCAEFSRSSRFAGLVAAVAASPAGNRAAAAVWIETLDQPSIASLELPGRPAGVPSR